MVNDIIVSIHQPNYLPWLGFFAKIKHSNIYVNLNIVQYTGHFVTNRTKLRGNKRWFYITIPISHNYTKSIIYDIKLPDDKKWMSQHWESIERNYKKAPFFNNYSKDIKKVYESNYETLWELNMAFIKLIFKLLMIDVKIINANELVIDKKLNRTNLIVEIVKQVGGTIYLSGPSGIKYMGLEEFKKGNIKLNYFNFKHPIYKQRFEGFEMGMAAIDLLFNAGEKSKDLINGEIKDTPLINEK